MDDLDAYDGLDTVLKPHLEPGETPLWVGRPLAKRFSGTTHGAIFAGSLLVMIGLGGLAMACVALTQGPSLISCGAPDQELLLQNQANNAVLAVLPLLAGLIFGSGGIVAIRSATRTRQFFPGTIYAVTTRRALVVDGFRNHSSGGWDFDQSDCSFGPRNIRRRLVL